jgi:hypothetical protein
MVQDAENASAMHRQAWENRGSITPDAADAVSYREKIVTIIPRVIQMVALNC